MADLLLSNIMLGNCSDRICVRVSRFWDFNDPNDETKLLHSDMVLVDEEGNAVHAQVYPPATDRFKQCITEGNVYSFSYFRARNSGNNYKPIANDLMLVFSRWTKIEEVINVPPAFPVYFYSLASMDELQARMDRREQFTDVIGVITAISSVVTTQTSMQQGESLKRTITILMPSNAQLDVVLWSERATAFPAQEIHKAGQESPQVAIFVGTLVKSFGGMSLSGGSSCKWYINPDVPESNKLMISAKAIHKPITWAEHATSSAQKQAAAPKMVSEILNLNPFENQKTEFLVTVTLRKINSSWWYNACRKCMRTSKRHGDSYKCTNPGCGNIGMPLQRFKLCILAGDETGDADFILFGRQAQRLTRKAADTLVAENPVGFIPDELTKLLERTFKWTASFTDSTTDSGNITFQVNTVVGEVTQEGGVVPVTPAGSQASSIIMSAGACTTMLPTPGHGASLTLSSLPATSEASLASTATPTKPALLVPAMPASPLSVKNQERSPTVDGGSSQKSASRKRSRPSPSKKVTKKLFTEETGQGDVGSDKDGGACGQDSSNEDA